MLQRLFSFTILICLLSCSGNSFSDEIDLDGWKSDNAACNGIRESIVNDILDKKPFFLGLPQEKVVDILGNPDRHQLYNRNQKFFIYYLDHSSCDNVNNDEEFRHLSIRFNSLGKLSEIVLVN